MGLHQVLGHPQRGIVLCKRSVRVFGTRCKNALAGFAEVCALFVAQVRQWKVIPGDGAGEREIGFHSPSNRLHPGDKHRRGRDGEKQPVRVDRTIDLVGDDHFRLKVTHRQVASALTAHLGDSHVSNIRDKAPLPKQVREASPLTCRSCCGLQTLSFDAGDTPLQLWRSSWGIGGHILQPETPALLTVNQLARPYVRPHVRGHDRVMHHPLVVLWLHDKVPTIGSSP